MTAVDLLAAFARARDARMPVAWPRLEDSPLFALRPELPVGDRRGIGGWLARARAGASHAGDALSVHLAHASSQIGVEWHRELRRYAGDDRLPVDLRGWLRESGRRALARAASRHEFERFPRRLLREPVPVSLAPEALALATDAARRAGIPEDRPMIALEIRRAPDAFLPAIAWAASEGYIVVRVGEAPDPVRHPAVIDLPTRAPGALLELFAILRARFVVCESARLQQLAYLTNTPSLRVNARDPFSAYPVRAQGVFTLASAVDLDTGALVPLTEVLSGEYARGLRTYGFRGNSAAQVLASVQELHEMVTGGALETPAQQAFRRQAEQAGEALADVPLVAAWGPDAGFIGDGRLARWQADAAVQAGRAA